MIDPAVWAGVRTLLDDYACIGPGDRVILLYTSDSHEPAAWVSAVLELRGIPCRRVRTRPIIDEAFAHRVAAVLPSPDIFPAPDIAASRAAGTSPAADRALSQAVPQAVPMLPAGSSSASNATPCPASPSLARALTLPHLWAHDDAALGTIRLGRV